MKIVHFSTIVTESTACVRLHRALLDKEIDSVIISSKKYGEISNVIEFENINKQDIFSRIKNKLSRVLREKREKDFNRKYKKTEGFLFTEKIDGKNFQTDPKILDEIKDASVIHLHWICLFLSISDIKKLSKSGKKIVWTFHDIWPLTGGCHCEFECDKFKSEMCGMCPIIHSKKTKDISTYIMRQKIKLLKNSNITIIAPSQWMKNNVINNKIFKGMRCEVIPNTIDTNCFKSNSAETIEKLIGYKKDNHKIDLLFSSASVKTPYKGSEYFFEMLSILREKNEGLASQIVVHLLGGDSDDIKELSGYNIKVWGRIENQQDLASIYGVADCLIYPSICDNLPNTIMEALACETPVIAFDIGGISDLVDHRRNGYLARPKDPDDMIEGLLWLLENNKNNVIGKNGRCKVLEEFSEEIIVNKHKKLYEEILNA